MPIKQIAKFTLSVAAIVKNTVHVPAVCSRKNVEKVPVSKGIIAFTVQHRSLPNLRETQFLRGQEARK